MASLTQWTWVWANPGWEWRTGKPGVLQSMGSQKVGHDLATEQWLLYNVVLVSAFQHHEPAGCIHIFPPSWTTLPSHPSRSSQSTKLSFLCYMQWSMSFHKRNEIEPVKVIWMNLEPVTQSEVRREKEISYINSNTSIWNLEKWYWWTYLQGRQWGTDTENTLVDTKGKESRGWTERVALTYIDYHM